MRKSLALTSLALAATLALTACGSSKDVSKPGETKSGEAVSAPSAEPVKPTTPTPTKDDKKSPRGNLIASIGDIGTISDGSTKKETVKFTVDSIAPGTCTEKYSRPAENGQIMLVKVTIETTPELAQSSYPKFTLSGHDFKYIAKSGTTFNGNLSTVSTYSCIPDAETFPSAGMGPAEKVSGTVVLDVPAGGGILVLKSGLNGGFEYGF